MPYFFVTPDRASKWKTAKQTARVETACSVSLNSYVLRPLSSLSLSHWHQNSLLKRNAFLLGVKWTCRGWWRLWRTRSWRRMWKWSRICSTSSCSSRYGQTRERSQGWIYWFITDSIQSSVFSKQSIFPLNFIVAKLFLCNVITLLIMLVIRIKDTWFILCHCTHCMCQCLNGWIF